MRLSGIISNFPFVWDLGFYSTNAWSLCMVIIDLLNIEIPFVKTIVRIVRHLHEGPGLSFWIIPIPNISLKTWSIGHRREPNFWFGGDLTSVHNPGWSKNTRFRDTNLKVKMILLQASTYAHNCRLWDWLVDPTVAYMWDPLICSSKAH